MRQWTLAAAGAALLGWGCASEYRPCVSHTDCGSGLVCTEAFVCQPPAPEGAEQCVSARQGLGLASINVDQGQFRGDVGPFRGMGDQACDMAGFDDGDHLLVNTVIPTPRGPAMTIFRLRDGLIRQDLVPGRSVTFNGDTDAVVHGCADWTATNWGFDIPSDQVTVTVDEARNGDWIYRYTAHFPSGVDTVYGTYGAHTITGTFQVQRRN